MAKKKKRGGVKKLIRQAGPNISKKEMKQITKAAGGNVTKAINRIAAVQSSMKDAGKTAPSLASGAANMLIKQAQKAPAFQQPSFGTSKLGQTLQSMLGTPNLVGPRDPQSGAPRYNIPGTPGFNPGGRPDKNRMIGGTVIRPGGSIAVKKPGAPAIGDTTTTAGGGGNTGGDTGGDTGGNGFDMQSILDAIAGLGDSFAMPEMPDYSGMFDGMFDSLSSDFDMADPLQLAALGQAYGGSMMRARQRQRRTRSDYLRNRMNNMALGGIGQALAPMMIGGGLTL